MPASIYWGLRAKGKFISPSKNQLFSPLWQIEKKKLAPTLTGAVSPTSEDAHSELILRSSLWELQPQVYETIHSPGENSDGAV